ncbi:hypothetical protein K443DRAFT_653094, partial [Laccaria amethystina LaAM-08-1]
TRTTADPPTLLLRYAGICSLAHCLNVDIGTTDASVLAVRSPSDPPKHCPSFTPLKLRRIPHSQLEGKDVSDMLKRGRPSSWVWQWREGRGERMHRRCMRFERI